MTELLGYADRRSVRPGDRVSIMVSTDAPDVRADLVRFVDGSPDPPQAPARREGARPPVSATGSGGIQEAGHGSWADLPLPAGWDMDGRAMLRMWFFSTTPPSPGVRPEAAGQSRMTGRALPTEDRRQVIAAIGRASGQACLSVVITADGHLAIELDGVPTARTVGPIHGRSWYGLLVSVDAASVMLQLTSHVGSWFTLDHEERFSASREGWRLADTSLLRLATWRTDRADECFNGKIAAPSIVVHGRPDDPAALLRERCQLPGSVVGAWDPSLKPAGDTIVETGPGGHHGRTFNLPTRAVTGPFWVPGAGTARITPQHDAIHFHADDVGDLGWAPTLALDLPQGLRSGVYAIRLEAADQVMHVPLTVRPVEPAAPIAFLVPTNTYLAYANHRMFLGNSDLNHYIASHPVEPNDRDVLVLDRPYLGRSVYDLHDDSSGVCMASWARPLVSFEPEARDFLAAGPRHFAADLYIVGWLERAGLGYDALTDEDLDVQGVDALRPYRVVVTGSHPEYWTSRMMDALQRYLRTGGKLMYLGGNGFYWMTSLSPDGSTMEVRRGHQGTRAWDSEPGEAVHASTGELGGLWRNLGICPQAVVGVGMAAQGWGGGRGYRRLPDSFDPRVASFFDGIAPDEVIGSFGFVMCGAVGDEVDRMDRALGTPPHALHLATSQTLPDEYQLAVEEVRNMTPGFGGTICDAVRSDMVWFDLPGGGEVFSVGSVSWAAALGWQEGDNNVDRLSTNVLRAFMSSARRVAADRGSGVPLTSGPPR